MLLTCPISLLLAKLPHVSMLLLSFTHFFYLTLFFSGVCPCTDFFCPVLSTEENGLSLLQLIGNPPPSDIEKVYGPDNSPGYVFSQSSNTGQLAHAHLPNPFYRDFSLMFHVKPTTTRPGIIFSVTDATQQIMYVGVKLGAVQGGRQQILLYYTEPDSTTSYLAASFTVPSMQDQWTRFALSVNQDTVTLFFNCDSEPQVVTFERSPDDMDLENGAGIFVGQAGGADSDKFLVCNMPSSRANANINKPFKILEKMLTVL